MSDISKALQDSYNAGVKDVSDGLKRGVMLGDGHTSFCPFACEEGNGHVAFCPDVYHEPGTTKINDTEEKKQDAIRLYENRYLMLSFSNTGAIDSLIRSLQIAKAEMENLDG